jgi:drug/metabolite transporter (DMT)-like permease
VFGEVISAWRGVGIGLIVVGVVIIGSDEA